MRDMNAEDSSSVHENSRYGNGKVMRDVSPDREETTDETEDSKKKEHGRMNILLLCR
jgi:hypothetical protein